MFIKKAEYEILQKLSVQNKALVEQNKRLADMISAEVKDCKMGPWCSDCKHRGYDFSRVEYDWMNWPYAQRVEENQLYYCKKHLHDLCPEFEKH